MKTIKERAEKAKESYDFDDSWYDYYYTDGYIKGATEQNNIIRDRLTEMQGEYITLELINELFEDEND